MTGSRSALIATLMCMLAAVAWAQDAPAPDDASTATSQTESEKTGAAKEVAAATPGTDEAAQDEGESAGSDEGSGSDEGAPRAASKEDAAEQLRKEAQAAAQSEGAAPADGAQTPGAPPEKDEDSDFIPTEKIWADSAIAFPSDI